MKKLFALFVAAGILAFMACGGGADKEKEQKMKDSLKKDSIAKAEKAIQVKDSLKADSIMKADTTKKGPKDGPKNGPKDGPKDNGTKGDRPGGTQK
jgi:hypothetical protein